MRTGGGQLGLHTRVHMPSQPGRHLHTYLTPRHTAHSLCGVTCVRAMQMCAHGHICSQHTAPATTETRARPLCHACLRQSPSHTATAHMCGTHTHAQKQEHICLAMGWGEGLFLSPVHLLHWDGVGLPLSPLLLCLPPSLVLMAQPG